MSMGCFLAADHLRHRFEALLVHRFTDDGVGLLEGVDAVDPVDVQFADVHGQFTDAVE